ncbi:sulfite exporter TauE/SafE family protein [Paroceanicella profunda]|uniref:Probable membrane transporter protein n=1 Tax=Paroceanicella profunda TaxID=2579971 RepID=A0A5B8FXL6_9RHOB|nr:sulfite exporter TauE/SafE family protein [Paroceanicella profunda]QDL92364.1 sulfite exporter TauE/SafE family protein [Paroceanicella profunda]
MAGLWADLATPQTAWLALFAVLAGVVRGFSGFGAALVFMPLGALIAEPRDLRVAFLVMNLFGPLPLMPDALRRADRREVLRLSLGAVVGVPLGIWLLMSVDPAGFRLLVALICLAALAAFLSGWRYRRTPGPAVKLATGFLAGIGGGFAGVAGPPVVLFYLGGQRGAVEIRSALFVFFYASTLLGAGVIAASGLLTVQSVALGLVLTVPHTLANMAGGRLFGLAGERDFRYAAYAIMGVAALLALPIY